MKKIPEGNGTMFDNTVVVWVNELAIGNKHTRADMPVVVAGSCGGYFKTGRYLKYNGDTSHNQLLVSLCNAMDVTVNQFGDPAFANGPLPKLTG